MPEITTAGEIKTRHIGEQLPKSLEQYCECCKKSIAVFDEIITGEKHHILCNDCSDAIEWFCKEIGKDKP